ncbi:MAG: hypothetical protein P8N94_00805 [Gammaproteobacteria bacterium]|nr:hypothetical protein [Gammaproteobacteria bacterium]MDG2336517.1 hypothetical protein [Gammaproteobacteria bacterium]
MSDKNLEESLSDNAIRAPKTASMVRDWPIQDNRRQMKGQWQKSAPVCYLYTIVD